MERLRFVGKVAQDVAFVCDSVNKRRAPGLPVYYVKRTRNKGKRGKELSTRWGLTASGTNYDMRL
jgi:hypothetical protein